MAYQFSTGFDFYTSSLQIFDARQLTTETISSANARFTGTHSQGCKILQNGFLRKNLTGNSSRLIMGVAINTTALVGNTGCLSFDDNGTQQVSLNISTAGVFQFVRGAPGGTAIGAAGSTALTATIWHYVEADVTFATGTGGSVACWLDGVQIINSSSLNTSNTGNAFANQFRIGELRNGITSITFDDLYCLDGTGGSLNARLGDRRIMTIMPAASGSFTQFQIGGTVPAATNWQSVNEIPPDDDVTYVSDGTVNDRDSYVYETVVLTGNPDAVIPWARIKKDDAGAHTVELSVRNGGVDAFTAAIAAPTSYAYVNGGAFVTNPNGGGAWDQTGINGTEFGIKIIT